VQLARLFSAGFDGTSPTDELLALVEAGLGGVVLFQRNVESPEQVLRLTSALKRAAHPRRLVVSIDQEGGRVARLRGAPWAPLPPMRLFGGAPRAEERVRLVAALLARELRAVGIDLDFAPVLDVDTNPANPVIGDRAFSRDPSVVARLGAIFIEEMQRGGVAACGKHFPGHGDTDIDSHLALPRVAHDAARLAEIELVPFRAAARAGVAALMTAHVVCEALDPTLPASLSRPAVRSLRDDVGFDGVIVSDDLEMGAVANRWPVPEAAARAIAAGCDHLLVCRQTSLVTDAIDRVSRALDAGALDSARASDAILRWETLADRFARPEQGTEGLAWLRSEAHAEKVARAVEGIG
jgi:beta-N-acetylhexosaminidase